MLELQAAQFDVRTIWTECVFLCWGELRSPPGELLVGQNQTLQSDGEADIAARHHVLDLELQEAGREAQLLDHPCVFPGGQPRLLLAESDTQKNTLILKCSEAAEAQSAAGSCEQRFFMKLKQMFARQNLLASVIWIIL